MVTCKDQDGKTIVVKKYLYKDTNRIDVLSSEAELDPKLFDKMSNFFRVSVVFLGIVFSIINTFELQRKDLTANPPIQRYVRETNERPSKKSNLKEKEKGNRNRRNRKQASLNKDKMNKKENQKQKIRSSNNSKKESRTKRRFKSRNKKSQTPKKKAKENKGRVKSKSRNLKKKIKNKNKQSKSPKYKNNGKGKGKKKQKIKKKLKNTRKVTKKNKKNKKRRKRLNGKGKIKKKIGNKGKKNKERKDKKSDNKGKKKKGKRGNKNKKSVNKGKKGKGKKKKKIGNLKKGINKKSGNKDKKKKGKKNNKSIIKVKGRQTSPEDCLKAAVSIMETYRFQVTNFDRQKRRVERQLTVASSKANKSTVFPILAGYVGGLSCGSSSTKAKLSDLNSTLSQCQTNVFKACVTDMPKANKTFVDECVILTEIFIVSILPNIT